MNEFDLERLGDVWRQRPDPAELEGLRRTADAVRRRARWAQLVDAAGAVAVAGVMILLVLANPRIDTALVGGSAVLVLLAVHRRHRRLRQLELRGLAGSTEQMIDQSIARIDATRKRTQWQLILLVPGIMLGLVVAHFGLLGTEGRLLTEFGIEPTVGRALRVLGVAGLAVAAIYLFRSIRRSDQERDRLNILRDAYREEGESTSTE